MFGRNELFIRCGFMKISFESHILYKKNISISLFQDATFLLGQFLVYATVWGKSIQIFIKCMNITSHCAIVMKQIENFIAIYIFWN